MTFFTILFFFFNDNQIGYVITESKEECSQMLGSYTQSKYDLFCTETGVLSWTMHPKPRPDTLHQEQQ
jgi:hypothetical protein